MKTVMERKGKGKKNTKLVTTTTLNVWRELEYIMEEYETTTRLHLNYVLISLMVLSMDKEPNDAWTVKCFLYRPFQVG